MKSNVVIAIDGPAGAGKSTVSKLLAKRLDLRYLDSGAMYRAIALKAIRLGVDPGDERTLGELAEQAHIEFGDGDPQRVWLDGEDVTEQIRTPTVSDWASRISVHPAVRRALVKKQQRIVAEGGVTLEGRDATTVIAPDATLKVFLTASVEERARRRWLEYKAKGDDVSLEAVLAQVLERDRRDTERESSPLTQAEDAMVIDSGNLTPGEVVEEIIRALVARGVVTTRTEARS